MLYGFHGSQFFFLLAEDFLSTRPAIRSRENHGFLTFIYLIKTEYSAHALSSFDTIRERRCILESVVFLEQKLSAPPLILNVPSNKTTWLRTRLKDRCTCSLSLGSYSLYVKFSKAVAITVQFIPGFCPRNCTIFMFQELFHRDSSNNSEFSYLFSSVFLPSKEDYQSVEFQNVVVL